MILLDIKMPECCSECDFQARIGWCCTIHKTIDYDKSFEQRLPDCPLREIETPTNIKDTLETMGEKIKELRNEINTMNKVFLKKEDKKNE